jgi:hypothetical protein
MILLNFQRQIQFCTFSNRTSLCPLVCQGVIYSLRRYSRVRRDLMLACFCNYHMLLLSYFMRTQPGRDLILVCYRFDVLVLVLVYF